jgi:hypothetical protein
MLYGFPHGTRTLASTYNFLLHCHQEATSACMWLTYSQVQMNTDNNVAKITRRLNGWHGWHRAPQRDSLKWLSVSCVWKSQFSEHKMDLGREFIMYKSTDCRKLNIWKFTTAYIAFYFMYSAIINNGWECSFTLYIVQYCLIYSKATFISAFSKCCWGFQYVYYNTQI